MRTDTITHIHTRTCTHTKYKRGFQFSKYSQIFYTTMRLHLAYTKEITLYLVVSLYILHHFSMCEDAMSQVQHPIHLEINVINNKPFSCFHMIVPENVPGSASPNTSKLLNRRSRLWFHLYDIYILLNYTLRPDVIRFYACMGDMCVCRRPFYHYMASVSLMRANTFNTQTHTPIYIHRAPRLFGA